MSAREWIHGQCVGCPVPAECSKRCPDLLEDVAPLRLGWLPGGRLPEKPADLAPLIDHTILMPEATRTVIERACADAVKWGFAAVCVNSSWIATVTRELRGTRVRPCATVGFPLGAAATSAKVAEARDAADNGALEIDVVINVGLVRSGEAVEARDDLRSVVRAVPGIAVKAILETCCLSQDEKATAAKLALEAGAAFLKTSTGFGPSGANVRDIALLRKIAGSAAGVKASGGVRDAAFALELLRWGASRLGSSSSVKLVQAGEGRGTLA
jgi:deoxyribose-phosphate aldolase